MNVRVSMWIAIGVAAALGACAAFSGAVDEPGEPMEGGAQQEGAADAIGADGGSAKDGATADVMIKPGELLENSNFAQGCSAPWKNNEATLTDNATTAQSAPKSCRACGKGATAPWSIYQSVAVDGGAGLTYKFEAYVRTEQDAGAAADLAACELKVFNSAGNELQKWEGPSIVPNAMWQRCETSLTLSAAAAATATRMDVIINGLPAARCFLVDDASLVIAP